MQMKTKPEAGIPSAADESQSVGHMLALLLREPAGSVDACHIIGDTMVDLRPGTRQPALLGSTNPVHRVLADPSCVRTVFNRYLWVC